MSEPLILRTRPTTVEARQVTTETRDEVIQWIAKDTTAWPYGTRGITWVDTEVGGIADAFIGDWVVKTAFGEIVRVPDSVMFARYEAPL